MKKLVTLVVKNAPTTAIREVIRSKRISVSFICRLRNMTNLPSSGVRNEN